VTLLRGSTGLVLVSAQRWVVHSTVGIADL